jgi:tRNA pseudouridine32 synthase/23S rRNA pseudouridine746 synthase
LFKHGKVGKTYWAVVEGGPEEVEGRIDLPLGRLDSRRGWWMKVDPLGLPSATLWRVAGRGTDANGAPIAWLELTPLTGRTHQLRVHCSAMGWAIVGDPIYGTGMRPGTEGAQDAPVLQLLARRVIVPIQKNKDPVDIEAPVPAHMRDLMTRCGWSA